MTATTEKIETIALYHLFHTPEESKRALRLTDRQADIMDKLPNLSVAEIAELFNLKVRTVADYITNIYRKVVIANKREQESKQETEQDERKRLTAESIALGIDVFSIMLKADCEQGEREAEQAEQAEQERRERIAQSKFSKNFRELDSLVNHAPLLAGAKISSLSPYWQLAIGRKAQDCGESIALSVLRKCEQVGGQNLPLIERWIADIIRDRERDKNRDKYLSSMYSYRYNRDGERVRYVKAGYTERQASKLCGERYGDGTELVHVATLAILEQIDRQRKLGQSIDFERVFTVRELSKRVMIGDSLLAWRERETFPIRELFRIVRGFIGDSASIKTAINGYTYTEQEYTDSESGETATAYKRGIRYADLGGEQRQRIGDTSASVVYSADEYILDEYAELIERMELTAKQVVILRKRLQGYGIKAIATALGVSKQAIQCHLKAIQARAIKAGIMAK